MWLVSVVIRRYIDILIIIINFPHSTCIRSFFGSSILTSLFIFKCFFGLVFNYNRESLIRTSVIQTRRLTERSRCALIRCITCSTRAIDPRWLLCVLVLLPLGRKGRVVLTIEEKLKICDLLKNGRSLTSVAAEFNVGKSTIHDIVKNKAKLQTFLMEIQDGDCTKRRIVRRANLDALVKAVYLWFV